MKRPANIEFLTKEENECLELLLSAQDLFDKLCEESPQSPQDSYNFGHYLDAARSSILLRGARRLDPENLLVRHNPYSPIGNKMAEAAASDLSKHFGGSDVDPEIKPASRPGDGPIEHTDEFDEALAQLNNSIKCQMGPVQAVKGGVMSTSPTMDTQSVKDPGPTKTRATGQGAAITIRLPADTQYAITHTIPELLVNIIEGLREPPDRRDIDNYRRSIYRMHGMKEK